MRKPILLLISLLCLGGRPWEDSLRLDLQAAGPSTAQYQDRIDMKISMTNLSQSALEFVKPGDGSESGWREPLILYSAEKKVEGQWRALERHQPRRCGLYNPAWHDDFVKLKPGNTLSIGDWVPGPEAYFDLSPGLYRFRVHYDYAQGQHGKGESGVSGAQWLRPELRRIPAFQLVSNPVEITIVE